MNPLLKKQLKAKVKEYKHRRSQIEKVNKLMKKLCKEIHKRTHYVSHSTSSDESHLEFLCRASPVEFNSKYKHGFVFDVEGRMKGRNDEVCWAIHPQTMDGICVNSRSKQPISCVLSTNPNIYNTESVSDMWYDRSQNTWMNSEGVCQQHGDTGKHKEEIRYVGVRPRGKKGSSHHNHVMMHSNNPIRMNIYHSKGYRKTMHVLGYYNVVRHELHTLVNSEGVKEIVPVFYMERYERK